MIKLQIIYFTRSLHQGWRQENYFPSSLLENRKKFCWGWKNVDSAKENGMDLAGRLNLTRLFRKVLCGKFFKIFLTKIKYKYKYRLPSIITTLLIADLEHPSFEKSLYTMRFMHYTWWIYIYKYGINLRRNHIVTRSSLISTTLIYRT